MRGLIGGRRDGAPVKSELPRQMMDLELLSMTSDELARERLKTQLLMLDAQSRVSQDVRWLVWITAAHVGVGIITNPPISLPGFVQLLKLLLG